MDDGISMFSAICLILFLSVNLTSQTIPKEDTFKEWVDKLKDNLLNDVSDKDRHHIIFKGYQKLIQKSDVIEEENYLRDMVRNASLSIEGVLKKKMEALRRSVKVAEDTAANYSWNPNLQIDEVKFVDTKKIINDGKDTGYKFEYNERFKQKVNTSVSAVHIPVEIYEGSIDILNGLRWSAALDKVFEENFHKDKEILWQYFGSQTGFMRTLPASMWNKGKEGSVDLFDVRRQPWYTQGSSSPKDMLILVDTSGSVHGQALQLIKVAVKSLLDTLGENDFVNIAKFSSTAEYVGCFKTFVQANHRNKEILTHDVDDLEASGMADFKVGLTFAFESFANFSVNASETNQGANCNQMIMLLTDGGTETAEEVFNKYNPLKTVPFRVFSYAVGPIANPVSSIRWMACRNRGYFSQIPAMGAIRAKVQKYVDVTARPLALGHVQHEMWTSSHQNSFVRTPMEYIPVLSRPQVLKDVKFYQWGNIYYDKKGLGMITTVTLPVYNRTTGASNQTILGVMGIDVQTKELQKHTPKRQLGPNGYSFAINLNGYIIFHPNLRAQKTYSKDPPNVDLLEIEVEDAQKDQVRKMMIDRKEDKVEIDGMVIAPDGRHIYQAKRKYGFKGIEGSTFSLGMVQPEYAKYSFRLNEATTKIDPDKFSSEYYSLLIAPWDYYKGMLASSNRTKTTEDIKSALLAGGVEWDNDLLYGLYFDILAASKLQEFQHDVNNLNKSLASFVATLGGLTLVHPKDATHWFEDRTDTWKDVFYRRALDSPTFIYEAPYTLLARSENDTLPPIFVAKAIKVEKNKHDFKPAVTGTVIAHDQIQDIIIESTSKECDHPERLLCYILDDGGFLIATNSEEKKRSIGRFFAKVDPLIMEDLVNTSVYKSYTFFDYQGECKPSDNDNVNAGPISVRIPSITWVYDFLSLNWWTSAMSWSLLNFNIYNWLFSKPTDYAYAVVEETHLCTKIAARYSFHEKYKKGIVYCNNCTRDYLASRIDDSNLMLIVTDPECPGCVTYNSSLIQESVRATGKRKPPDQCDKTPRYRRRPNEDSCYSSDEGEDTKKCGGWSTHLTSYWVLAASSFLLIITSFFQSFTVL